MSEVINEVRELERQIEELKDKYYKTVEHCSNKDCTFYKETGYSGYCSFHTFVEECGDYSPEQGDNK